MCKNSKIISSTKHGQLSICNKCKQYTLVFNNILLQFCKQELHSFRRYINNINEQYWLDFYAETTKKRKIPISTRQNNLVLLFSEEEFNELKSLLLIKEKLKETLSVRDINYPLILN